ncbi:glycosyltransferase [Paenibacillus sp. Soil724D2]|uniref:glycosyltransferase n=1 Tax=Paenibacillus sp. (strain Soil724D2) TaxID=1736392 RepID=UPI000714B9F6|nr:glycosyltransferase [Paenibacillus sp. Soil724D2]KRE51005.1 capsular biosynthesis protein [Paenibacillus sp. Soil724D2]
MHKNKILITVFDMEIGGIERSLINMLESFDYDKYDVDLFICHHSGDFLSLIPEKVNLLPQIPAYTVFRKSMRQCLQEGHYSVLIIRLLSKVIAAMKAKLRNLKEGPGYIQMQLDLKYTSYVLPKLKKNYDLAISYAWPHDIVVNKVEAAKKIAWIHTDYSELGIDNKLDLAVWNKFGAIASISDACTEAFLKTYPSLQGKIKLIENITSPTFIKRMADEHCQLDECKEGTFYIVSVGRLSYVKGFDMAVKALRILHDKGLTHIKWFIVGYGGYEAELKELIVENRLEDSFVLLGKKINPYPYIRGCDLYVQPSRYEGKAVTVTEAQILGKPILLTNYPTARSQIEEGVDGVICGLSIEEIAEEIERLHWDSDLRSNLANSCLQTDYSNTYELNKIYNIVNIPEQGYVMKEVTV